MLILQVPSIHCPTGRKVSGDIISAPSFTEFQTVTPSAFPMMTVMMTMNLLFCYNQDTSITYLANILSGFVDSASSAAASCCAESAALSSDPTTVSVKQIVKPSCCNRPSTTSSLDCVKMTRRLTSTRLTHRSMSTTLFCITS